MSHDLQRDVPAAATAALIEQLTQLTACTVAEIDSFVFVPDLSAFK